jgi:hypothetical protein
MGRAAGTVCQGTPSAERTATFISANSGRHFEAGSSRENLPSSYSGFQQRSNSPQSLCGQANLLRRDLDRQLCRQWRCKQHAETYQ